MYRAWILNYKTWMQEHIRILIIGLILACLSFPNYKLSFVQGIDGPLPWVFNYFADGHYALGRGILFPHGPLAFMLYPLPMGNNLGVTVFITLLCSVLFSFGFFKIYFSRQKKNYLLPTLLIFVVLSFCDLQLLLIGISATQLVLYHLFQKKQHLILASLAAILNLYLKTYGGVISLLLLFSYFLYLLTLKKNIQRALLIPLLCLLFFYVLWLSLYQTFSGSLYFMAGQLQLSSDNSEAVSYYQVNNWFFIGLSLLSFILIPFFTKDKTTRLSHGILILPLFAAWKHAMSRADSNHVNGFLIILIVFSLLLFFIEKEKKIVLGVLCICSVSGFALNMALTAEYNDYRFNTRIDPSRSAELYSLIFRYDSVAREKNGLNASINASEKLPDTLLHLIGKKTIDVFPWNYSTVAVNKLNWIPRPSLHSYASYTAWLDEQNKKHFLSADAPHFVLWEIDELGGKLNSIDFRYLLNDAPETMLTFFSSYHLIFKDKTDLLFEKQNKPATVLKKRLSEPVNAAYNSWIQVPEACNTCITRAKIRIKKSASGSVKSLFYKGEAYSLEYQTEDGKTQAHKIVPKNAEEGLWINPLILNPETDLQESMVKKIRLRCWGESSVTKDFEIEFEEVRFQEKTPFLEKCFQKKDSLH